MGGGVWDMGCNELVGLIGSLYFSDTHTHWLCWESFPILPYCFCFF